MTKRAKDQDVSKNVKSDGAPNAGAPAPNSTNEKGYYDRWKNKEKNKMGNDISSEIKIANSGGADEGGSDKRWHMEGENE